MTVAAPMVVWIGLGVFAGTIARLARPGNDSVGWVDTTMLGVVGAVLGGWLAWWLGLCSSPFQPAGLVFAALGAIAVLAAGFVCARSPGTC